MVHEKAHAYHPSYEILEHLVKFTLHHKQSMMNSQKVPLKHKDETDEKISPFSYGLRGGGVPLKN